MPKDDRKKALDAAKSAVRTYSKDPSEKNAARVTRAWDTVKGLQVSPIWQRHLGLWLQSDSGRDDDLKHMIEQAVEDAKRQGRDDVGQTDMAVRAVLQVRPDMNASDALAAVRLVKPSRL